MNQSTTKMHRLCSVAAKVFSSYQLALTHCKLVITTENKQKVIMPKLTDYSFLSKQEEFKMTANSSLAEDTALPF